MLQITHIILSSMIFGFIFCFRLKKGHISNQCPQRQNKGGFNKGGFNKGGAGGGGFNKGGFNKGGFNKGGGGGGFNKGGFNKFNNNKSDSQASNKVTKFDE